MSILLLECFYLLFNEMRPEILALLKDIGNGLQTDQAWLKVVQHGVDPNAEGNRWIYKLEDLCYDCPFKRFLNLSNVQDETIAVATRSSSWKIVQTNDPTLTLPQNHSNVICEFRPEMGEFGKYLLEVRNDTCIFRTTDDPVEVYSSLVLVVICIAAVWALYSLLQQCCKTRRNIVVSENEGEEIDETRETKRRSSRVLAIDVFRGFVIVFMIFVNNGGGGYPIIEHATWNGLHLADLVFPSFIWIMGLCIPISISVKVDKHKISKWKVFCDIVQRSIILFILGITCNTIVGPGSAPDLCQIRIMGVLQRFGLCYFVVSTVHLIFRVRGRKNFNSTIFDSIKDVFLLFPQWIIAFAILGGYLYLIFGVDVEDCSRGYFGPGGIDKNSSNFNCPGGIAGYIDRFILTPEHMYSSNEGIGEVFQSPQFDPENILGTLPSIFQTFLGLQTGYTLLMYRSNKSRIWRWMIWGVIYGLAGGALCGFQINGGFIPVNKSLWSISFVLVTTSFASIAFSLLYLIVDVNHSWTGQPFLAAGMNSILLYMGHEIGYRIFPFRWSLSSMNTHFVLLLQAAWATAAWMIVAVWFYKKKIFLKV